MQASPQPSDGAIDGSCTGQRSKPNRSLGQDGHRGRDEPETRRQSLSGLLPIIHIMMTPQNTHATRSSEKSIAIDHEADSHDHGSEERSGFIASSSGPFGCDMTGFLRGYRRLAGH